MSTNASATPTLCIVTPCYNEEAVLPLTIPRYTALLNRLRADGLIAPDSHLLLVDDGSQDRTWSLIEAAARDDPAVRGLKLSRNGGHQNAVLAGLMECDGDLAVSIDADLQDDAEAIEEMVHAHREQGAEIVYGVRADRSTDTAFKRVTAQAYYAVLRRLGVEIVYNHADFRLMGRRAIEALRQFSEVNLFLRGIVPMVGFRTAIVEYARAERAAGTSKYPTGKMLSLAWEGVTSLSVRPLRIITAIGAGVSVLAFAGALIVIYLGLTGQGVAGWASILCSVFLLGGLQLFATGLIGEYIGKTYIEVKRRPRYIVEGRAGGA